MQKNGLNPIDFVKRNFCSETEGVYFTEIEFICSPFVHHSRFDGQRDWEDLNDH
jgi:hypothetical protein